MENKNSEILALKSRELLNDQINSVDTNNSKAGTFISISALFIPLSFSLFDKFEGSLIWIIVFFIPILLNLIGLFFLIKALLPKKISHGIDINQFDSLLEKTDDQLYLFEVGINRDCFKENKKILNAQNNYLKKGLIIIYSSALSLALIFFLYLINTKFSCYDL